jgi:DNA repair exonuclease SbcCD ATPase subunit
LTKKGLSAWIFSSLTIIAAIHLTDAISAVVLGNPINLLKFYPFINEKLAAISPQVYLWATAAATFILWGITCVIVFESPVEAFLNQILSEAKTQTDVEGQLLENKSEVLDAMYETVESSSETLAQVKDMVCNVRIEAKEIEPLRETLEKIKTEIVNLRKEIRKIDEKPAARDVCPACGRAMLPEFNLCPYCGEAIKQRETPIINLKDYR